MLNKNITKQVTTATKKKKKLSKVHHSLTHSLQEMNINATLGLGALEE
jgi:hypothetical protein